MENPEMYSFLGGAGSLIIGLVFYAYYALGLMVIANKTDTPDGWMAWIPILNLYLMCRIARKPWWWMILFFIPFVNFVISIVVLYSIIVIADKPGWWILPMLIPVVNIIFWGLLAFTD